MKDNILAISGKGGLFRLVSGRQNVFILETIDEAKKRCQAGARDSVISLNNITMYTDDGDKPLMEIFQVIADKYANAPVPLDPKKASGAELAEFMEGVVPNYDRDRVYASDLKKLVLWYNILVSNGYTEFADEEETEEPD